MNKHLKYGAMLILILWAPAALMAAASGLINPISPFYFGGATFGASGCSISAHAGGAFAGTYTSGTTGTCTVVITIGGSNSPATAPTGWTCWANDLTTPADKQGQTASSTTTATISGTTVSGDVVNLGCVGF